MLNPRKSKVLALGALLLLALPPVASLPIFALSAPLATLSAPLPGYKAVGVAPADMPVLATLAIPLRNVGQLETLVSEISDPASPLYRHFISTQQAGQDFLPTAAFDSLLSYVRADGFQVETTALDSEIVIEGTAAQFQSAFGSQIDTYTNGTFSYYISSGSSTFQGAYLYASNASFLYMKPATVADPRPNSNVTFTSETFPATDLQPVYNATSLYGGGFTGAGRTIGLLDYYGSPTVAGDLVKFNKVFGLPDAKLNIVPVGPYDPSLGVNVGWSTEVALDVEASHAMAPGASIDLYVANGALPLAVPLAKIVQDDAVTTLSQSFGTPEWYYSISSYLGGPTFVTFNALIPDQYYALGSAEGITFMASSGDGGGSGFSSGPEGNLEYPSTSPFVTSVGGTQTYFAPLLSGGEGFVQTAWSSIGFVPNLSNEGGGGGGASILEPKPWYQQSQVTPATFVNGRLNPDLSLQAGVDPATEIVDGGQVVGVGGTSESSPLLAGLLTLLAQSLNGSLGLVNPFIYDVGNNPAEYQKAFSPITFGYTIPWTASLGYNLATGWGSPNVGELAPLLASAAQQTALVFQGVIFNQTMLGQLDYTPKQNLTADVRITEGSSKVTSGSFTMNIQTTGGTFLPTPMVYNPASGNWTGTITVGNQSGIAYINIDGTAADGASGHAIGVLFVGYVGSITVTGSIYSIPADPWSWDPSNHLNITVFTSDLLGNPAPAGPVTMDILSYSILNNRYTDSSAVKMTGTGTGAVTGYLATSVPVGPIAFVLQGDTYAYAPSVSGIYLQTSYIYPDVAASPGSAAPGQFLTIITTPIAPVNVYFETSFETGRTFAYDVSVGSNVTATLVNPARKTVSTADLTYQPCAQALRVCNGGADVIYGQLQVPSGATPGLYDVMLHASYGSYTPGGNLTGSFYGQVWVSGPMLVPSVTLYPSTGGAPQEPQATGNAKLFQGEHATVVAHLAYANGTSVTYGEFSAIVYPHSIAGQYTSLMHTEYEAGELIPLSYDPGLQAWVGNVSLPSSTGEGGLAGLGINSFDYSGPYDVYVTGVSADGTPTSSELGAQQPFFLQPYVFTNGTVSSIVSGSGMAFSGATISASGSLSGDLFLGNNTVEGGVVTISDSQVQGTLDFQGANVTLVGVSGGDVVANDTALTLKDSTIGSLVLSGGSNVTVVDSSYQSVTPSPPTVAVGGLSSVLGSTSNYTVIATGEGLTLASLIAWLDGAPTALKVNQTATGVQAVGIVNATALADGVHALEVVATASDGLSTTFTTSFSTNAHQQSLEKQDQLLFYSAAALAVISVAALIVGVAALRRKGTPPGARPTAPQV